MTRTIKNAEMIIYQLIGFGLVISLYKANRVAGGTGSWQFEVKKRSQTNL